MTWYLFRARQARENGEPPPDEKLVKPPKIFHPGCLYNGMIAPLVPYGLRGVIWGEGEADLVVHYYHASVLAGMIQGWRGAWGRGELPIVGLQLSSFGAREETPGSTLWGELRGAQAKAFSAPNTGLVVTADLNEAGEPLPKNKLEVGRRAARWALGKVYGREGSSSGPSLERISIEEGRVRVVFGNLGGGLQVRGERLAGFAIAGEDKVYQWAEATIDGPSVLLSSPKVPKPVAVRYGWSDHPELTLFSRDGWPAGPFRSEPWVTEPPPPRGRRNQ
jgi:sialate O-acetylesterase